jgi:hypothetical protein
VTDADEPPIRDTLGYGNEPVETGYCAEYADVSPDILNCDDGNEAPEGRHRISAVSPDHDEPESEAIDSPDSGSESLMEDGSSNTNPGFETGELAANDQPGHEQGYAVVATPQHAPDDREQKGRPR